ncbi:MAG: hypothetical protein JSV88_25400 [Candidatus Aminicenantes bacterium]|nr:MAG: hypothetical protein JSV88_25400 [Candidatus Aminicenantes bacterium]
MSDIDKNMKVIPEKNKVSGLCYVYTDSGIELPVLDITHPLFISSINEEGLEDLCKESAQRAESMKAMPDAQKQAIIEKSYIFGRYFNKDPNAKYLSGMSTFMLKLGPHLIGGGEERQIDRMMSMGVISVAARMRLRDICRLQADTLIPQLMTSPQKKLCFINIAGGAASDSINTLILVQEENQSLLQNRKIEIIVFDVDTESPNFAGQSLEALKAPGCHFHGLDISFNHIKYNWADTGELSNILPGKRDCILVCTSEGGLFEYGSDEEIINNLDALYDNSPDDMRIIGTFILDIDTVDPTMAAMAEESGGALRLPGTEGFKRIIEKTEWKLDSTKTDKNPIYAIFALKKERRKK